MARVGTGIRKGVAALAVAAGVVALRGTSVAEPPATKGSADLVALSNGLTADQQAELRFLEHLGWTFDRDPAATEVKIHAGTPCYRRDPQSMKAGGDLRVTVPATIADPAAFGRAIGGLPDALASRCAYKQKISVAVREATRKLSAIAEAGEFTFPQWLVVPSPIFRCTLPEPEWKKDGVENLCTGLPSKGIGAVYEKGGVAECYTAQWLAIFATQMELYGPAWFDQVFTKEELRIGRPQEAYRTVLGQHVDEGKPRAWKSLVLTDADLRDDPVIALARLGPKAFAGATGVLQNDEEFYGANQNFMVVSVSPRAVEELKARGGVRRILELTSEAVGVRKEAKIISASERAANRARREAIYADPLLAEFKVYCHPYGVISLGELAELEITDHARPIKIRIYVNGLDDVLYQRYRMAWKQRWLRENAAAVVPPPAAPAQPPPAAPVPVPAGDELPPSPPPAAPRTPSVPPASR
jgi:hypothetical protein